MEGGKNTTTVHEIYPGIESWNLLLKGYRKSNEDEFLE